MIHMGIAERVLNKITANRDLRLEPSLCSRFRTPKSDCSQCVGLCPAGALSVDADGPEVSADCSGCGVCYSVCPNDVITLKERGDEQIIGEIAQAAKGGRRAGTPEFHISCERGDSRADLLVPCLGRLTEVLLIEPVRSGFSSVTLLRPECSECPNAKASLHIDRTIERASALLDMLNLKERLAVRSIPLQPLNKRPEKSVSRRELFSAFRMRAAEVTAAALPESCRTTGPIDRTFLEAMGKRAQESKRGLLLRQLRVFSPGKEVRVSGEQAMLATVSVSSRCNACGVCATLCPSGALSQRWDDRQFTLSFRASLCNNCRVCAQVCMPKALTIENTARLNDLLEDKERTVFAAEKRSCPVCRMNFVRPTDFADVPAGQPDTCPSCRERQDKQMAFIKNELFR
jgi:ferredoxin